MGHSYICQLKYLSVLLNVVYYGENIDLMIIHENTSENQENCIEFLFVFFALRYICLNIFPKKQFFEEKFPIVRARVQDPVPRKVK